MNQRHYARAPHVSAPARGVAIRLSCLAQIIVLSLNFAACGTNSAATATRAVELETLATALAPTPVRYTNPSFQPTVFQIAPPVGPPPSVTIQPTTTINAAVATILNSQQATSQTRRAAGCDSIIAEYRRTGWTLDLSKPYATLYAEILAMNGVQPGVNTRFSNALKERAREWLDACLD